MQLIRLEADSEYPDSTFVEDTAVLISNAEPSLTVGLMTRVSDETPGNSEPTHPFTQVVLTRPGAVSRRDELMRITKALEDFFPTSSIHRIEEPGKLDGGDVCEAGDHFFIGISERTNEVGAKQLANLLAGFGLTSSLVDIRAVQGPLHLKSPLAHLSDHRLVVTEALADRDEFAGYELIRVKAGEEYAANCICVNDYVLIARGYPNFEQQLRGLGYSLITLDMSEFQKMDGGLSCLSLRF